MMSTIAKALVQNPGVAVVDNLAVAVTRDEVVPTQIGTILQVPAL